jgi:hypothetical protein
MDRFTLQIAVRIGFGETLQQIHDQTIKHPEMNEDLFYLCYRAAQMMVDIHSADLRKHIDNPGNPAKVGP